MKKEDFLKNLSDMTGIAVEKITENVTSEKEDVDDIVLKDKDDEGKEIDITMSDLTIFKPSELAARLKNHASSSANTFIEMAVKKARNDNELEFEGKTVENLVKAAMEKGKKEAGIKPNEKNTELEGVIKTLRQNIINIEDGKETEINTVKTELSQLKNDSYILSNIPDGIENYSKKDLATLFKSEYTIKSENGIKEFYKDGVKQVVQKSQDALTIEQVMSKWLEAKNITMTENKEGRNLNNEFGKTSKILDIKNTKDFYEYCKANKILSKDRIGILREIQKESPEFILD